MGNAQAKVQDARHVRLLDQFLIQVSRGI